MNEMKKEMLALEGVRFRIGDLQILNGVDLKISSGETVGIIGPNGSGKTTLFNCISGFHFPQEGTITFQKTNITKARPFYRAHLGIGRVFQNSGVFREMSVLENMVTALESKSSPLKTFFPWSKAHRAHKAEGMDLLAQVGLDKKANDKAGSLSGGQLRLLEIIRTLGFDAELLLLDEPTAGVSPKMKDDVAGLIVRLQELGKTVCVIEHDINFIQQFCTRIVVLDSGRVVLDGTPESVREDKRLQEIYFGTAA